MRLTLWPACVRTADFRSQLTAAQSAGYTHLPIGLATYKGLLAEGHSAADIRQLYKDHGVEIGHYDGFSAWAPVRFNDDLPDEAKIVFDASGEECLEICDQLGIDTICATGTFNPDQFPETQLNEGFLAFCEQAASAGVQVDLEFLPMWGVKDLATAKAIIGPTPIANAGLMIDTWHFFRSGSTLSELAELPSGMVRTIQLADATEALQADNLFEDCLLYRRPSGEGELDIDGWLAALAHQPVNNIGPEIFSLELDQMPADDAAKRCLDATRASLLKAGVFGF